MDALDLYKELYTALDLASQAGQVIMEYYERGPEIYRKVKGEPVTVADHAADRVIAQGLRTAFPSDGLLTEESDDDLSRLEKERVWIVDPLDGTEEFIAQSGEFAVQIALSLCGQPVLGVVYQPARERLFHAVRGQGAYQRCDRKKKRLRVSTSPDVAHMRLVASRAHYSPLIESARRALGISSLDHVGSVGLKVSMVACGEYELYVATTISKEWDICAPHVLLLEAGGTLTNLCGEPLTYNKPDVRECGGLIASNGQGHAQIVETLARLRRSNVSAGDSGTS